MAAYPGTGDACSTYGNRSFFYLFLKNFGPTGGGKPNSNGSSGSVSATGPDVTIPNNRNVTPTAGGRAITAATPAVATGLAAGFNALGLPYVWGGGGGGAGPNNGCDRGGVDYNSWLRSARSRRRRSPSS